jgi:hypothetical protein
MMARYLIELVRVTDDDDKRVMARYPVPDNMVAELVLSDLSDDALLIELKRRWGLGGAA